MSSTGKQGAVCWVKEYGGGPCSGETRAVPVPAGVTGLPADLPGEIELCFFHFQELNETGFRRFLESRGRGSSRWRGAGDLPDELAEDRHLTFLDPGVLEGVSNSRGQVDAGYTSAGVSGYEDIRELPVNLEELALTDRQLTAVCLVFYGGVKKKRAARAMNISAQALSDHVKAALNKIRTALCEN